MSFFTSFVTKVIEIHDPDDASAAVQTVTIRRLAPKHLKAASKAAQMESIASLREIGADMIKQINDLVSDDKAIKEAKKADPLLTFDRVALMERGITSWSLPEERSVANFEDLDDATQEYLAREILRLAKPSLFESAEDEQKKADGPVPVSVGARAGEKASDAHGVVALSAV